MTASQTQLEKAAVSSVFDEMSSELSRTYAEALVNVAEKSEQAEEILEELDAIRAFVATSLPTFALMMGSPLRSAAEKDKVIVKAFEGRVSPTSSRFLRVLNRHGRLELLGAILGTARTIWERRQSRFTVTVRSVVPLSPAQQESLSLKLSQALSAKPILRLEVDPALIGGLVVQVGDDVYDASVRKRLEQVRNRLFEGTTHEIQSRRDQFSHPE
jgi:F-type H+-transporting ATPase subunit delta